MIKARHNKAFMLFFGSYFKLLGAIHFRKMEVAAHAVVAEGHSVLLLQNHFSWWDGYWSYWLSCKVFKRKFHVMMLEEQLLNNFFLNRCGAFSVKKNNRQARESLRYASDLLNDAGNLVAIYPRGQIASQYETTIPFQQGIGRVIDSTTAPVEIVLAVVLTDYFSRARPEVRFFLETYRGERTVAALENAYQQFYRECTLKQLPK